MIVSFYGFYSKSIDSISIDHIIELRNGVVNGTLTFPMLYDSVEYLAANSDAVIIGKVVSDGEHITRATELPSIPGEGNRIEDFEYTFTQIKVDKLLYGDDISDEITLSQVGKPTDNNSAIKVKKGWKVVIFLRKLHDYRNYKNLYATTGDEQGIFVIGNMSSGNDKAISLSKYEVFTKYDKKTLDDLLVDIGHAKEFLDPIKEKHKGIEIPKLKDILFQAIIDKEAKQNK